MAKSQAVSMGIKSASTFAITGALALTLVSVAGCASLPETLEDEALWGDKPALLGAQEGESEASAAAVGVNARRLPLVSSEPLVRSAGVVRDAAPERSLAAKSTTPGTYGVAAVGQAAVVDTPGAPVSPDTVRSLPLGAIDASVQPLIEEPGAASTPLVVAMSDLGKATQAPSAQTRDDPVAVPLLAIAPAAVTSPAISLVTDSSPGVTPPASASAPPVTPSFAPSLMTSAPAFAAVESPASQPAAQSLAQWSLTAGHTIGQALKAWSEKAQWTVVWNLPRDIVIPANTTFVGDFPMAATEVIKTLAANGALIKAQIYQGNRTMVISGPGTTNQ